MIVISGALVAVALLLLVVGLTVTTLNLIYASIAVSALSLAFLLVGIYQRRGELPVAEAAPAPDEEPTYPALSALPVRPSIEPRRTVTAPAAVPGGAHDQGAGDPRAGDQADEHLVLIVAGRPRYHVEDCRYLIGKQAEEVTVPIAQSEGFTACVVCKPDAGSHLDPAVDPAADPRDGGLAAPLELVAAGPLTGNRTRTRPSVEYAPAPAVPVQLVPVVKVPPSRVPASRVPTVRRAQPLSKVAAQPVPATRVPATRTAAKAVAVEAVADVPAVVAGAPATGAGPTKRAGRTAVLPPADAVPSPADLDRVVVIADRTKFHVSDCRFVRLAADTSLLTRQAAQDQGYLGCGVCKP